MAKNPTNWTNNITKPPTSFTTSAKGTAQWSTGNVAQIPYLYDDSTMTYDSVVISYDYLNPQQNQLNNLNNTAWASS